MITATFIDPQGTQQTDAVVYVRFANYSKNEYQNYNLSSSDFSTENESALQSNAVINCSFYYWTSAQAKTDGRTPYILANSSEADMDFSFQPDSSYDGLTLKQKAEKYFSDVLLPTLQG